MAKEKETVLDRALKCLEDFYEDRNLRGDPGGDLKYFNWGRSGLQKLEEGRWEEITNDEAFPLFDALGSMRDPEDLGLNILYAAMNEAFHLTNKPLSKAEQEIVESALMLPDAARDKVFGTDKIAGKKQRARQNSGKN